jgi:ubiquinone/menaquinone biosynthesis C-methylase UbiE
MERVLEKELMDDVAQSLAYAKADFSVSNQVFVDGLLRDYSSHLRMVVDLGCGPADVDIRLARVAPGVVITAVDGSQAMIGLAERAVRASALESQIILHHGTLPGLALPTRGFDAILSKDLLHHLPDPRVLWKEIARLGRRGAAVYVMDLIRPPSFEAARRIVESVAPKEDELLKRDFFNSLCAAFTVDEVRAHLDEVNLGLGVGRIGERHMLVQGLIP